MDTTNSMTEKDDLIKDQTAPEQTEKTPAPEAEAKLEQPVDDSKESAVESAPEPEAEPVPDVEVVPEQEVSAEPEDVTPEPEEVEAKEGAAVESKEARQQEVFSEIIPQDEEEEDDDEEDEGDEEADAAFNVAELSKQELYERLKALLENEDVVQIKGEVEAVKHSFYKKNKVEIDQQRADFIEKGGSELDFIPTPTELEEEFKELLNEYKNRRSKFTAQLEKEKENNLLKKNHIIAQMKQLTDTREDVSANIAVFRQLQQDWKNTGPVPASAVSGLWREYNQHQEAFWDLIKINNELREYDFRKNLEAKNKLIEAAEALDAETDVVSAFRQLQKLHEEWHELGPVARELREETWGRFKAASTIINKKHQSHFEEIRAIQEKNLELKVELCEKIEAIDTSKLSTYKEWDGATKNILDMQEEWRQIGFAPRKSNQKIFERYRKACDVFFSAKAEFYKTIKASLNENLEKKKALCEKAEAMKDSTDWKEATEAFIQIQKEWKTIGPTPKKSSNEIWKRFITACDYFFEQKNKNVSSQRGEEQENLVKKKELIEKIRNFEKAENPGESLAGLRALAAEWNSIGHVPFKEKDKIYKEYRSALDAQFDALNISASQRRLESFKSNLKDMTQKGESKLYRERDKLMRAYENLKNEIATYENNIGFLNISSKKGGGMLQEMERKIEALKEECRLLEQKINMIDENI